MKQRRWTASVKGGPSVTFECPYFDELLPSENEFGVLTRDLECHALWHYYGLALLQYKRAKANLVEESELSLVFNQVIARNIFQGVAQQHGVNPEKMLRFWPVVNRQRIALGGGNDLPEEFKFQFWGNQCA